MTQEAMPPRDLVEEWWDIHGKPIWAKAPYERWARELEAFYPPPLEVNPWTNGDYAFLAIVCGFLFMLTVSVGVSV